MTNNKNLDIVFPGVHHGFPELPRANWDFAGAGAGVRDGDEVGRAQERRGIEAITRERTAATEITFGEDFAAAVARARKAVGAVASRLQERLEQARRFVPSELSDKEDLIAEVKQAKEFGLRILLDGREVSKLTLKRGTTLNWQLLDGGNLGFRKNIPTIEAASLDPEDQPQPVIE